MPLKEQDLKDNDSYKKAVRMDLPKVNAGDARFWLYKDVSLPTGPGKQQKYSAFLALVDDSGVRKALAKNRVICKGTCGMKDGKIAFEPIAGRVPYKSVKVSVPLVLGRQVFIPKGMEDDDGGEVADGANGTSAGQSVGSTQNGQTAKASQTEAWTKLVADAQSFLASHPERKDVISQEMAAIGALLKAGKSDEATARIERLSTAINKASGSPQPGAQSGASSTSPQVSEKEFRARFPEMQARFQEALKEPGRDVSRLRAMAGFVSEKARAGDFDAALKAVLKLEEALAAPVSTPTTDKTQGIDYKISLLNWDKAKKDVRSELNKLQAAIIDDFKDEPKLPEIKAALSKLQDVLDGFDERLQDTLDAAMSAAPEERPELHKEALKIIDDYLAYVDSDEFIEGIDDNPFVSVAVRDPLEKTLNRIAEQLKAA